MNSLNPRGLQSVARANENATGPDLRELQPSGSRRFLDQANKQVKRRESSADKYTQKLQMVNLMPETEQNVRGAPNTQNFGNSNVRK